MKQLLVLIFCVVFSFQSFSQRFMDRLVPNAVYANIAYAGKIQSYSINYERYLGHSDYITYYAKVAAGYWKLGEGKPSLEDEAVQNPGSNDGYMFPVGIHGILFNSNSHLEMGFGINTVYENLLSGVKVYPIVSLGYRYQPLRGGIVIRVNGILSHGFFPGVSIGYSF